MVRASGAFAPRNVLSVVRCVFIITLPTCHVPTALLRVSVAYTELKFKRLFRFFFSFVPVAMLASWTNSLVVSKQLAQVSASVVSFSFGTPVQY